MAHDDIGGLEGVAVNEGAISLIKRKFFDVFQLREYVCNEVYFSLLRYHSAHSLYLFDDVVKKYSAGLFFVTEGAVQLACFYPDAENKITTVVCF